MFVVVIAGLATMATALISVHNQPLARDRHRNRQVSAALLVVSGMFVLAGLIYGATGLL